MPGYKVCLDYSNVQVGIVAESLKQLKQAVQDKLGLQGPITVSLDDGTLVCDEDYFNVLEPQTRLTVRPTDIPQLGQKRGTSETLPLHPDKRSRIAPHLSPHQPLHPSQIYAFQNPELIPGYQQGVSLQQRPIQMYHYIPSMRPQVQSQLPAWHVSMPRAVAPTSLGIATANLDIPPRPPPLQPFVQCSAQVNPASLHRGNSSHIVNNQQIAVGQNNPQRNCPPLLRVENALLLEQQSCTPQRTTSVRLTSQQSTRQHPTPRSTTVAPSAQQSPFQQQAQATAIVGQQSLHQQQAQAITTIGQQSLYQQQTEKSITVRFDRQPPVYQQQSSGSTTVVDQLSPHQQHPQQQTTTRLELSLYQQQTQKSSSIGQQAPQKSTTEGQQPLCQQQTQKSSPLGQRAPCQEQPQKSTTEGQQPLCQQQTQKSSSIGQRAPCQEQPQKGTTEGQQPLCQQQTQKSSSIGRRAPCQEQPQKGTTEGQQPLCQQQTLVCSDKQQSSCLRTSEVGSNQDMASSTASTSPETPLSRLADTTSIDDLKPHTKPTHQSTSDNSVNSALSVSPHQANQLQMDKDSVDRIFRDIASFLKQGKAAPPARLILPKPTKDSSIDEGYSTSCSATTSPSPSTTDAPVPIVVMDSQVSDPPPPIVADKVATVVESPSEEVAASCRLTDILAGQPISDKLNADLNAPPEDTPVPKTPESDVSSLKSTIKTESSDTHKFQSSSAVFLAVEVPCQPLIVDIPIVVKNGQVLAQTRILSPDVIIINSDEEMSTEMCEVEADLCKLSDDEARVTTGDQCVAEQSQVPVTECASKQIAFMSSLCCSEKLVEETTASLCTAVPPQEENFKEMISANECEQEADLCEHSDDNSDHKHTVSEATEYVDDQADAEESQVPITEYASEQIAFTSGPCCTEKQIQETVASLFTAALQKQNIDDCIQTKSEIETLLVNVEKLPVVEESVVLESSSSDGLNESDDYVVLLSDDLQSMLTEDTFYEQNLVAMDLPDIGHEVVVSEHPDTLYDSEDLVALLISGQVDGQVETEIDSDCSTMSECEDSQQVNGITEKVDSLLLHADKLSDIDSNIIKAFLSGTPTDPRLKVKKFPITCLSDGHTLSLQLDFSSGEWQGCVD